MFTLTLTWLALATAAIAAAAALYGHYRELPEWMTGPEVCRIEGGGCAVLFRSPRSALLGVPNAGLGLGFYAVLALGLGRGLAAGVSLAFDSSGGRDECVPWLQLDRTSDANVGSAGRGISRMLRSA